MLKLNCTEKICQRSLKCMNLERLCLAMYVKGVSIISKNLQNYAPILGDSDSRCENSISTNVATWKRFM